MNSGFLITDSGAAAASISNPTGPFVHITEFKIGDGVNYTPDRAMTDLQGSILHTGVASGYSVVDVDTIEVLLVMDATVGPFDFGEIGLYLDTGDLFALSVFDSLQEKTRAVGNQAGSVWRIRARLKFAQAPVVCQVTLVNNQNILEVPGFQYLQNPVDQITGANIAIVHANNSSDEPVLVIRDTDTEWGLIDYARALDGDTTDVGAVLTPTTLTHPSLANLYFEDMPRTDSKYLIKVPDGSIRQIVGSASPTEIEFAPAVNVTAGAISVWTEGGSGARVSYADTFEYNKYAALFNAYWSVTIGPYRVAPNNALYPSGNKGSGQTFFSPLTRRTTPSDWVALVEATKALCELHAIGSTDLDDIVDFVYRPVAPLFYGIEQLRIQWESLYAKLALLEANRNVFNPAAMEQVQIGTFGYNTWWNGTKFSTFTFTYSSVAHVQALLNSGHEIKFTGAVTSIVDPDWVNLSTLLTSMGVITLSHNQTSDSSGAIGAIGLHELTGAYQHMLIRQYGGFYGNNWKVYVQGRQVPGSPTIDIQIVVERNNVSVYGPPVLTPGLVTWNEYSVRPSPAVLNSPALPNPTVAAV